MSSARISRKSRLPRDGKGTNDGYCAMSKIKRSKQGEMRQTEKSESVPGLQVSHAPSLVDVVQQLRRSLETVKRAMHSLEQQRD